MKLEDFFTKLRGLFDFSKYPKDSPFFDTSHKNELFRIKDEFKGSSICTEFVGLRSKCYAYKCKTSSQDKDEEKKICKGIKRNSIKSALTFAMYKNSLFNKKLYRVNIHNIASRNHSLETISQKKIALSAFESKRYVLNCGIHTRAFGSTYIKRYKGICQKCTD